MAVVHRPGGIPGLGGPAFETFPFRFHPLFLAAGLPFGIRPSTTGITIGEDVHIRFGPWEMRFPKHEVESIRETDHYPLRKVLGPPHLSFADQGVTFATNPGPGLCLRLRNPQPGIAPWEWIRHPAVTVTIEAPEALRRCLEL